jgi:hypothetical protein
MPRGSAVRAVTTIGIDMGKNTLHLVGLDSSGAIVFENGSRAGALPKRSRQRVRDQVAHMAFRAETRMRSSARGYP